MVDDVRPDEPTVARLPRRHVRPRVAQEEVAEAPRRGEAVGVGVVRLHQEGHILQREVVVLVVIQIGVVGLAKEKHGRIHLAQGGDPDDVEEPRVHVDAGNRASHRQPQEHERNSLEQVLDRPGGDQVRHGLLGAEELVLLGHERGIVVQHLVHMRATVLGDPRHEGVLALEHVPALVLGRHRRQRAVPAFTPRRSNHCQTRAKAEACPG